MAARWAAWMATRMAARIGMDGAPRRAGLVAATLASLVGGLPGATATAATGTAVPELAAYDTEIEAFLARWNIAGAAVAVARNGRLVLSRGYGVADRGTGAPVQPDALFRIASVSKPITSAAVLKLVQDGVLSLDLAVFPYLARGNPVDARLHRITVRHLLEHSGGWDRDLVGDPMFQLLQIAQNMGVASPPDADTILRWMLTQPLQFEPGSRYAYSNFGYLVLGEVVAKASGQRYEDQVRTLLLRAGVTRPRLGASLPGARLAGEVSYHMPAGATTTRSMFGPGQVPWPYGGFAIEPMAAHGGWVASAADLVAFAALLDGQPGRADLLDAASLAEMRRIPAYETRSDYWYGKGWQINSANNLWHTGSLPGTTALLVSASNGMQWAVLLNQRDDADAGNFSADLDNTMWRAFRAVTRWPTHDLFAAAGIGGPVDGCFGSPTFSGGRLCLPVVEVPGAGGATERYTATLTLTDGATLSFSLAGAVPALGSSEFPARFDPATGVVTLPRVVLPDASGTAKAYRAELELLPGAGLNFRVRGATPL